MRCNVCGREIKPGQMFCQCGNTVNDNGTAGALNVNRGSSTKWIILAAVAGFLLIGGGVLALVMLFTGGGAMNDRTKWEQVTRSEYSITLPANMKETDILQHDSSSSLKPMGTYRNSQAIVDITGMYYTADQKRFLKRKKIAEMFKELIPTQAEDGYPLTPVEHGALIYVEYPYQQSGVFFGSSEMWVVEAVYVGNDALYEITVYTPHEKYDDYSESIFAWLDSFRPAGA